MYCTAEYLQYEYTAVVTIIIISIIVTRNHANVSKLQRKIGEETRA